MDLNTFNKIISLLKEARTQNDMAYKAKIDLTEYTDIYYQVITILMKEVYGEEGEDWWSWYMYENDFGEGNLEAYNKDGQKLFNTLEDFYKFLEDYKK